MTTAEKLLQLKQDFDNVYSAGYEKGKSEGGSVDTGLIDDIIEGEVVNLENSTATKAGSYVFRDWVNLQTVKLSTATSIEASAFQGCSKLTKAEFPQVLNIASRSFYGCSNLEEIVFEKVTYIDSQTFYDCSSLNRLVILTTSVVTLTNINAFNNSSIMNGMGFVYVPDTLVDSYKSATNWSAYASQIKPISELEVTTE